MSTTSPTLSAAATPPPKSDKDDRHDSGSGFATAFNVALWKAHQQSWVRAQLRKSRHEIKECVQREMAQKQQAKMQEMERVQAELAAMADRLRAAGEVLQKRVNQFEARERAFEARRVKLAEQHESQMSLAESRVQRAVQDAAASREALQIQLDEKTRALTHMQERLHVAESEFDQLRRRAAQQLSSGNSSSSEHIQAQQQQQQQQAAELTRTREQLHEVQLCLRNAQNELDRRCAALEQRGNENVSLERELCVCRADLAELRARHAALQKSWHIREHDYLRAARLALERERSEWQQRQTAAAVAERPAIAPQQAGESVRKSRLEESNDVPLLIAQLRRDIMAEMRAQRDAKKSRRTRYMAQRQLKQSVNIHSRLEDSFPKRGDALSSDSEESSTESEEQAERDRCVHARDDDDSVSRQEEDGMNAASAAMASGRDRVGACNVRHGSVLAEYPSLEQSEHDASPTDHLQHRLRKVSSDVDGRGGADRKGRDRAQNTRGGHTRTSYPSRHDVWQTDTRRGSAGLRDAASSSDSTLTEEYMHVEIPTWSSSEDENAGLSAVAISATASGHDQNVSAHSASINATDTHRLLSSSSPQMLSSEHGTRRRRPRATERSFNSGSMTLELPPRVPLHENGRNNNSSSHSNSVDHAHSSAMLSAKKSDGGGGVQDGPSVMHGSIIRSGNAAMAVYSPTPDEFARAATQSAEEAGTTRADMLIFVDQMKSNRQKLLDTGVYSVSDAVIREMDEKIKHYEVYLSKFF